MVPFFSCSTGCWSASNRIFRFHPPFQSHSENLGLTCMKFESHFLEPVLFKTRELKNAFDFLALVRPLQKSAFDIKPDRSTFDAICELHERLMTGVIDTGIGAAIPGTNRWFHSTMEADNLGFAFRFMNRSGLRHTGLPCVSHSKERSGRCRRFPENSKFFTLGSCTMVREKFHPGVRPVGLIFSVSVMMVSSECVSSRVWTKTSIPWRWHSFFR